MSGLVNIPSKLLDGALAEAEAQVTYRRRNKAEFGKLDHIDADGLLEELDRLVITLRAAAREVTP